MNHPVYHPVSIGKSRRVFRHWMELGIALRTMSIPIEGEFHSAAEAAAGLLLGSRCK